MDTILNRFFDSIGSQDCTEGGMSLEKERKDIPSSVFKSPHLIAIEKSDDICLCINHFCDENGDSRMRNDSRLKATMNNTDRNRED